MNGFYPGASAGTPAPVPPAAYQQPSHNNGNGSKVLRFETNIPQTIAIKYADGKPVEGRFGDQYLYTLTDGHMMYVPPIVATRINELEIKPGQPFVICKREVKGDGQKKASIQWLVERQQQPQQQAPAPQSQPSAAQANGFYGVPPAPPTPPLPAEHNGAARHPFTPDPNAIPTKIPFNVAFGEILDWMAEGLRARNEQWTDQARQDFVSTVLIAAQREGWVGPWERRVPCQQPR